MFDIVATNSVTILSFDAFPMGNTTIEIYYKVGTWNGFANTPAAWTFVGSAPVAFTGGFAPVPVNVNVTIPAGQTYGFYVTSNTMAISLNYSNGTSVGNVYSSDGNISFLEGGGMEYPFTQGSGAVYQPRVWNGNIHYALAGAPNSYLWNTSEVNPSINVAPTSTMQYTVEAFIAGCPTAYDTIGIIVSIPSVSGGMDQATCTGSQLVLHGQGAESYLWDNGVTDSVAFVPAITGPFIVTGTDSAGCTGNDTVNVTVNSLPMVDAGTDYDICYGDSTTLSGQGANMYLWDNGVVDNVPFHPMATSPYILTGTDLNGCVNVDTITVTVNSLPVVSAGADQEICAGSLYTLNGTGANIYVWDNGVTDGVPFVPGIAAYIVTGTDNNNCSNTDTMMFTLHTISAVIGNGGNTLVTSLTPGITMQWINCSNGTPIAGETNFFYSPSVAGNYAVIVTDTASGCIDTSACELVSFAGIEEMLNAELSVYPVPTNGMITVVSKGATIQRIELVDLVGKILLSQQPNAAQTQIDLSGYAGSTFLVRIFREGHTAVLKVLKN
jgi:hypothetical protein